MTLKEIAYVVKILCFNVFPEPLRPSSDLRTNYIFLQRENPHNGGDPRNIHQLATQQFTTNLAIIVDVLTKAKAVINILNLTHVLMYLNTWSSHAGVTLRSCEFYGT